MENGFEKIAIAFPGLFFFDFVYAPRRPCEHRRIDIAEIPFISGHLSVGMLVPLAQNDIELGLGEERIDQRQRNAMEREIPRGVPRIFPFVRHRHDALVVKMPPLCVAAILSLRRRRGLTRIAVQPILNHVVIELLRPKHSGQRLAMNKFVFGTQTGSL